MGGFKAFLLRGNLVDLAVAFVIGAAFATIVQALVRDLITPLIAAIFGRPDFSALTFTFNKSMFRYGDFINAVVAFLIVAAVLYFLVVRPYAAFQARFTAPPTPEPPKKDCPHCLSRIPEAARRCAFCAADLAT
jgi:large conductance mechanosensitive channel